MVALTLAEVQVHIQAEALLAVVLAVVQEALVAALVDQAQWEAFNEKNYSFCGSNTIIVCC